MISKFSYIGIVVCLVWLGVIAFTPQSASADVCCETDSGWVEAGFTVTITLPNNPDGCDKIEVWSDDCDMEWRQYSCLPNCTICYRQYPGADCAYNGTWMTVARVAADCHLEWRPAELTPCTWTNYIRELEGLEYKAIQAKCNC